MRSCVAAVAALLAVVATGPPAPAATLDVPLQFPTLESAYRAAQPGDVIAVAPGVYAKQTVPRDSKAVVFRGAAGTKLRELDNFASNVTFDGVDVDAAFAKVSGLESSGNNVTFKNASVGNVSDEKGALISGANFTFDNVLFHDAVMTPQGAASGVHMECVYAIVVPGFTVRNSTFRDCSVMDLFFTYGDWWSPLPPNYGNVTIENNVFAHPERTANAGWHYYGLYVANNGPHGRRVLDGWIVRNNTFETTAVIPPTGINGTRWVGNIGDWDCATGVTYRHNVGKKCSTTDKAITPASSSATTTAPFGWTNPAAYDFTLTAGSPAIDAADPNDAPTHDRNGNPRDNRPDAGAHEHAGEGGLPPIVRNVRLRPSVICRRSTRSCKQTARLRVRVRTPVRVRVRVERLRSRRRPLLVRQFERSVSAKETIRLPAQRLRAGRYRVSAFGMRGAEQHRLARFGLRVR